MRVLCGAGDDPLQGPICAKDINGVAGLLKLYFRELKEPLFPTHLFDELINCSSKCTCTSVVYTHLRTSRLCSYILQASCRVSM